MTPPADPQTQPVASDATSAIGAWRGADDPGALPEDPGLRGWLLDPGSLTRRLRAACEGDFVLEVLGEGREAASPEDLRVLGTEDRSLHVRRVRLRAGERTLVHACTLVPSSTLAQHPWLTALGSSPLWEALAGRERVRRTPFEFADASSGALPDSAALRALRQQDQPLWARRSLFLVDEAPLLVVEFFLPSLASLGPP